MTTVADLDAQAQALRAEGLKYREIGERMGESKVQAWKRCNRESDRATSLAWKDANREANRERDRHYKRENCGTCGECGGQMGIGGPDGTCSECLHAEYDRKARKVVALWAEGKKYPEIQAEMGWSKGYLSRMLHYYREDGYRLPYRQPHRQPKHPELAA